MALSTSNVAEIVSSTKLKASIFLRSAEDAIDNEANPNTPKKFGNLRNDLVKSVTGLVGKIVWGKNYAIYQESKQYKNYSTPGTGPHFAENAVKKVASQTDNLAKSSNLT